jgi:plastocyanin
VPGQLPIAEINLYYVSGIAFACWAVLVTVIGVTRPDFPGSTRAFRATAAISITLVLTTIGTAVYEGIKEDEHHEAEAAEAAEEPAAPEPAPEGGGGSALRLAADPGGALKFDKASLTAPEPGEVTIEMTNDSDIPHDVAIEGKGVDEKGKEVTGGGVSTVSADLKPGEYQFYCSVPGHRQAGMEGTLTVR